MGIRESRPRAGGGLYGKRITARLKQHWDRMKEIMEKEGLSKELAAKLAYEEIVYGGRRTSKIEIEEAPDAL